MENALPAIPAKRYFTIGEVSVLCGVKPYVLRYWEQEFTQLKPVKRRGNRRYYQHHEVLLIRRIRELLYDQGFTISGARNRLAEQAPAPRVMHGNGEALASADARLVEADAASDVVELLVELEDDEMPLPDVTEVDLAQLRTELLSIRKLLG
jgi:DNA-binding transcriptional MerR regulator